MPKFKISVTFEAIEEFTTLDEALEQLPKLFKEGYWSDEEAEYDAQQIPE